MHISAGGTWALFRQESTPSRLLLSKTEFCPVHLGIFLQSREYSNMPKTLMASFKCPSSRTSQSGEGSPKKFCASSNLNQEGSHVRLVESSRIKYQYICALLIKSLIAKCFGTLYNHCYFFKFMYDQYTKRIEQFHFIYFS